VHDALVHVAREVARPDRLRTIDVGYRARRSPYYLGVGGREKEEIGERFAARAPAYGLVVDIDDREEKRIYGRQWYEFLADCRAVLGVEAGVSIFDTEGAVREQYLELLRRDPAMGFHEMYELLLWRYEGGCIPYRTISARHFEAAALRTCQILFEGEYSGIMKPMVHYVPLKKDFSNCDDVIRLFRDPSVREQLTENAYRDLIGSGDYSYQRFMQGFDDRLAARGMTPERSERILEDVTRRWARADAEMRRRRERVEAFRQSVSAVLGRTRLGRVLLGLASR
jgi:hypothetical protein